MEFLNFGILLLLCLNWSTLLSLRMFHSFFFLFFLLLIPLSAEICSRFFCLETSTIDLILTRCVQ